jgi:hypothetical protein
MDNKTSILNAKDAEDAEIRKDHDKVIPLRFFAIFAFCV